MYLSGSTAGILTNLALGTAHVQRSANIITFQVGHFEPLRSASILNEKETHFHGTTQIIFLVFYFLVRLKLDCCCCCCCC